MKKYNDYVKENGAVNFEEKEYAITQQPYINGVWDEEPYYLATAIDVGGNEYQVKWELEEDIREAYEEIERQREAGETPDYSAVEDEGSACDWDNPVEVNILH